MCPEPCCEPCWLSALFVPDTEGNLSDSMDVWKPNVLIVILGNSSSPVGRLGISGLTKKGLVVKRNNRSSAETIFHQRIFY